MQSTVTVNESANVSNSRQLPHQPMLLAVVAFAVGITVDRNFDLAVPIYLLIGATFLIGWAWLIFSNSIKASAILCLVVIGCIGGLWHQFYWNFYPENEIGFIATDEPQAVCLQARVSTRPCWNPAEKATPTNIASRGESSSLYIQALSMRDGKQWVSCSGKVKAYVNGHLIGVNAGDHLRIVGTLNQPAKPTNPGEFDFFRFQRTERSLSLLYVDHPDAITKIYAAKKWAMSRWFDDLRSYFDDQIWKYVDESRAPLASAILLGNREQIESDQRDAFMQTGTVHLLAISGLHVGILAASLLVIGRLGFAPRWMSFAMTIAVVIFYAILVEGRPPVLRATILVVIYCVSRIGLKKALTFNTLALAGAIVLAMNPAQLFQPGTQLSFLAVATIVSVQPYIAIKPASDPLSRLIEQTKPRYKRFAAQFGRVFVEVFLVSIFIWIVTMPLVASRFHIIAPIGIWLNPLLMIPIWFALMGGFMVLTFGWAVPPIAFCAGWVCDKSLSLIQAAISMGNQWQQSHLWVAGYSEFSLACFYGGVLFLMVFHREKILKWGAVFVAIWLVANHFAPPFSQNPDSHLVCTVIDVGHGTSVLMQFPDGRNMLYDGGSLNQPKKAVQKISSVLWSKRISSLDAIVISHADADHYNGIPELLKRFSVNTVYVSPLMFQGESEAVVFLQSSIEHSTANVELVSKGDRLPISEQVAIQVLHPSEEPNEQSDNSNSIVLLIDYFGKSILLPGDLEKEGLSSLVSTPSIQCDIAMSPHHGSRSADHESFAHWANPQFVVVSSKKETLSKNATEPYGNAKIFNTAVNGAIEFRLSQQGINVSQFVE